MSTARGGLPVVTEHMPDVLSVALGFWVGVGSRDEDESERGASHFLEHLLFKGTADRSARDIAEAIDAVGGEFNAFTTKDHTAYEIRVLREDLDLALDILCDVIANPAFHDEEVEAERQVILEELLMQTDEAGDLVHDLAAGALFADHPLGREVLGTEATIEAMEPDRLRAFHGRHYRAGAMVLAAAGRVTHDEILEGLASRAQVPAGGSRPVRAAPCGASKRLAVLHRPTEQAHVVITAPGVTRTDPARDALAVLDEIVGGGPSSRLFQEVREQRGLAYAVYSYRSMYEDAGSFSVYAGTAPGRLERTVEVLHDLLDEIAAKGVTDRELTVAKGSLCGSIALGLEDSGARAGRIGRSLLMHGEVPPVDDLVARIRAVSAADVAAVAARLLDQPRTVAVVGPVEGA